VGLYRWLERQSTGCTVVEDTPARIARSVARATRQREVPARTMLCLEVLEERGLINMNRRVDRIQITLCQVEHKVDLEASEIIKRLRRVLEEL
jgi:single-stranded-DNA-specific exonuclease